MPPTAPDPKASMPPGYHIVYQGAPLPAFYAAEMIRPYIGRTLWVMDSGGRTRNGELSDVPNIREGASDESASPVKFADERPLYLRGIICIAVYEAPK